MAAGVGGEAEVNDTGHERALRGRVALVTGSSRNIGRAIALALAREGADLVVHGHEDGTAARSVAEEVRALGVRAHVELADIGSEAAVGGLMEGAIEALGRLDMLVCNAAIRRQQPFAQMSFAAWREVLAVDLDGPFLLCRAAAPYLIAAGGGSIVCLGGSPSHLGTAGRAHVCAAKMGVVGLCRVLARELGPHDINVNVVAPGHIDTTRGSSAGALSSVSRERPMARMGRPEEVAAMVAHLCRPEGRYITGQTIHVNGGMMMAGA